MVYLSCTSLVCPVGYSAASAAAAFRTGISAFSEIGYRDNNGESIIGATVEAIQSDLRGQARLTKLIQMTLDTIDSKLSERLPWDKTCLILCSREADRPGTRLAGIVPKLQFPRGAIFSGKRSAHCPGGSTSAIQAVARAKAYLVEPDIEACLILAADTLIDARVLHWLDSTHRLKTSGRTDGVIPGEAACLAIVSKEPMSDDDVAVRGIGMAEEPATVLNEEPFRADGMTAALLGALQETGLAMHEVDFRLSDVAGESYAFEELVLAQTRLMRKVRPSQPLWHPADCIGDCGAAAGLIQFAWIEQAFKRNYAPGPVAALHTASAFGQRAAAIVTARHEAST